MGGDFSVNPDFEEEPLSKETIATQTTSTMRVFCSHQIFLDMIHSQFRLSEEGSQ